MEDGGEGEEREEKPRWRTRLTIKVGGKAEQQGCKCVMPLEWKDKVTTANRAPSAAAIPKISLKVKVPAQPTPAGIKRYPRIEDVQCPGRASPVAVVFKLAVPVGYERDLATKPGKGGKRKREEDEGSDYRGEEEEEEEDFELSSASSDDDRADASMPRGSSGRGTSRTAGAPLPVLALPPAKRMTKPGRASAEKAAKGGGGRGK